METSMTGLTEFEMAGVDLRGAGRFPMRSIVRVCRFEKGVTERRASQVGQAVPPARPR
jgi:hypothetical protein